MNRPTRLLALLIAPIAALTVSGCGIAAGTAAAVAVNKFQCESQGKYWDEIKGCIDQPTTDGETDTAARN
jgi:hypothetical protein